MKVKRITLIAGTLCLAVSFGGNGEQADRNKWRIAVGGAFNGAVRSSLSVRNLPVPASAYLGSSFSSKASAEADALRGDYGDQGFIHADDLTTEAYRYSENWKISKDARTGADGEGTSMFTLENYYEEIDPRARTFGQTGHDTAGDKNQFGISIELTRELWVHEAKTDDEHDYGLDFAAAFSYFFGREVFSLSGVRTRTDSVQSGSYVTTVKDAAATWDYDHEGRPLFGGSWYGEGSPTAVGSPVLDLNLVTAPLLIENAPMSYVSSYPYRASGDYQELEMLFMLRPWYEITDWWRVFAQVGVGVSWGRLDSSFSGYGVSADEDFAQWDCYGVAGLGTAFRYGRWDLAVDFLGRFLRDDLEVDGRYVSGEIERANWGFRVMLGYSF